MTGASQRSTKSIIFALLCGALCTSGCKPGTYNLDGGDQITVGKAFVDQRGCPMCHQSPNPSDGILSGQSTPRPGTNAFPANLTPDPTTGIGDWSDLEIIRAMRFGIDDGLEPLCPPMPHFDGSSAAWPFMTDLEANAIVAYLRSLPPVTRLDGGIPESTCPPLKPPPPPDLAPPPVVDMAIPFVLPDLGVPGDGGAAVPVDSGASTDGKASHD